MTKAPPTPKGFRDITPELAKKRREVIGKIVAVLEESGFAPIETPTVEFAETLTGKYGEEERLIYEFTDRGGRKLALRYDLTVPLARYVATYNPPLPFRRYQIGQVFRGENPQKGRFREFTQLDFDTVGSPDLAEDAKIIACALKAVQELGLKNPCIKINDRKALQEKFHLLGIPPSEEIEVAREIDKKGKIPQAEIDKYILSRNISLPSTVTVSGTVTSPQDFKTPGTAEVVASHLNLPLERVSKELQEAASDKRFTEYFMEPAIIKNVKEVLKEMGVNGNHVEYDHSLVRGLDYYTGLIFELKPDNDPLSLTIGAGGRYDNLIGAFAKKPIPAVGFSFGLDRLVEIL